MANTNTPSEVINRPATDLMRIKICRLDRSDTVNLVCEYINPERPRILDLPDLVKLHQTIRVCTSCVLNETRTKAVPGDGAVDANLMFVGEGPGYNEDQQGIPFVGAAGNFLDELLVSIGLDRQGVFITNMVKCRPPNNRDPFPGEIAACGGYLDAQIAQINPHVIVPLGRHALSKWFPGEAIGKVRAKPKQFGGYVVFPLYHPAAALHNGSLRTTIIQDFGKLGELLKELQTQSGSVAPESNNEKAPSKQLPMF